MPTNDQVQPPLPQRGGRWQYVDGALIPYPDATEPNPAPADGDATEQPTE